MTSEYYQQLFKYDFEVNTNIFEQIEGTSASLDKAKETLAHIVATKQVWLGRLKKQEVDGIAIWQIFEADQVKEQMIKNKRAYEDYLANISDEKLSTDLEYTNSKGKLFETPVRDILSHVLIHGGHHRGQIAKYVRKEGGEPLNTDYITYTRNRD